MSRTIYQIPREEIGTLNLNNSYLELQDDATTNGSYKTSLYNLKNNLLSDISVAGSDYYIQYNKNNSFSGSTDFIFTEDTNTAGAFYTGTVNPNNSTKRLNYNGNFHATTFFANGIQLTSFNATNSSIFNLGFSSPTLSLSFLTTKTSGAFYTGTNNPTSATRLNYDGNFHATSFNIGGINVIDSLETEISIEISTTDSEVISLSTAINNIDFSSIESEISADHTSLETAISDGDSSLTTALSIEISSTDSDITSLESEISTNSLLNISDDSANSLLIGNTTKVGDVNLTAQGVDTDIDINLIPKGSGKIVIPDGGMRSTTSGAGFIFDMIGFGSYLNITSDQSIGGITFNGTQERLQFNGNTVFDVYLGSYPRFEVRQTSIDLRNGVDEIRVIDGTDKDLLITPLGTGTLKAGGNHESNITDNDDLITKGYADINYSSGITFPYIVEDSSTNTSIEIAEFRRTTSGTATTNIGGYITIGIENDNGNTVDLKIQHSLQEVTDTGESSNFKIIGKKNGSDVDFIEIVSAGSGIGFGITKIGADAIVEGSVTNSATVIGGTARSAGEGVISIGKGAGGTSISDSHGTYSINLGYNANYNVTTGQFSIGIGSSTNSSGTSSIAIGYSTESSGGYSISIGNNSLSSGIYGTSIGASSIASANYSTSLGVYSESSAESSIALGVHAKATAIRSMIIAADSSNDQINSLSDSFKVMSDNKTMFHVGNTLGTQVTVNSDPDTNLTDAANGVIAYDSTDHEFRGYVNGSWVNMINSGGTSSLSNISDDTGNSLLIGNLSTTGDVNITSQGSSAIIDINLIAKGSGNVTVGNTNGNILSFVNGSTIWTNQSLLGLGTTDATRVIIRSTRIEPSSQSVHLGDNVTGWPSATIKNIHMGEDSSTDTTRTIDTVGSETNIDLLLTPKGTGTVQTSSAHTANISGANDVITKGYADVNYSSSGGTITINDNILEWDSGNTYYRPYTTRTNGSFYSGTINPISTTRLNYGGNFHAYGIYSSVGTSSISMLGEQFIMNVSGTNRTVFQPGVSDGAGAVAYSFDTNNTLSTSGSKLLSLRNSTTEKMYIDYNGNPFLPNLVSGTTSNVIYYDNSTGSLTYGTSVAQVGGSDSQVQYNNGGTFGGTNLNYDDSVSGFYYGSTLSGGDSNTFLKIAGANYANAYTWLKLGSDNTGFINDLSIAKTNYPFQGCIAIDASQGSVGHQLQILADDLIIGKSSEKLGFYGLSTGITKPIVTGSKGGNAALASLITALSQLGLITDSTT